MEPNYNNYGSPTELPEPQDVNHQSTPESINGAPKSEARGQQVPSTSPQPQQPNSQQGQAPIGMQPVGLNPPSDISAQAGPASAGTMIADDSDLIEKEWVTRAKTIVMQTKDDPHSQNREMNKVKADYLKKRYNKDLKITES